MWQTNCSSYTGRSGSSNIVNSLTTKHVLMLSEINITYYSSFYIYYIYFYIGTIVGVYMCIGKSEESGLEGLPTHIAVHLLKRLSLKYVPVYYQSDTTFDQ